MIPIANDNRGFLIAIVIVLALAVFSGGIRDKYATTGYYGSGDQSGSHQALLGAEYDECSEICRARYASSGYALHDLRTGCFDECAQILNERRLGVR